VPIGIAAPPGEQVVLDQAAWAARDEKLARRYRRRKSLVPYLYVAPALTMFVLFALAPFLHAVWLSFFDWDGITVGTWVGLDNYRTVFTDALIRESFVHAGVLVLFFSTLPVAVGMVIASVFTAVPVRGAAFFRVVIFLPQVVSSVVVGVIWNWVYATDGPLNALMTKLGLGGATRSWLGDFVWALPAIAMIGVWMLIGLCMVLFVAGVQQIPSSLYDAVKVDGAGRIREFLTVTWPGLRYELGVVLTLTVVGALRTFDLVFVLTRGGPGNATVVPGMLLYNRAFIDGRVGQACAIAVVLAVLVFAVTVLIDRLASRGRA
jgi:raffinose/stachyose/melibiose transport system permease protein